jgi:hypothetical protein
MEAFFSVSNIAGTISLLPGATVTAAIEMTNPNSKFLEPVFLPRTLH